MSIRINYNGDVYYIPTVGEKGWGPALDRYLVALATGGVAGLVTIEDPPNGLHVLNNLLGIDLASASQIGVISISAQEFSGLKTFLDGVEIEGGLTVDGNTVSGDATLIGNGGLVVVESPANTFTLTPNIIGSGGTVVSYDIPLNRLTISSDPALTLGAVGSSPNGNAASITSGVLHLQPADGSNPGVLTSGTQAIGGQKNFANLISVPAISMRNAGYQLDFGTPGNSFVAFSAVDNIWHNHYGTWTFESTLNGLNTNVTVNSGVASGSNAFKALDGARLNLSTADTSAYLYRSAANTIRTPGSLTVDANSAAQKFVLSGLSVGAVGFEASAADGTSAKAFRFNNTTTLATGNAMLMEVQNNGTKQFGVTYWGRAEIEDLYYISSGWRVYGGAFWAVYLPGGGAGLSVANGSGIVTAAYGLAANSLTTYTSGPVTISGTDPDGASAVGVILNNTATLSNATAKLTSFRNNNTEKAAVWANGDISTVASVYANRLEAFSGNGGLTLIGSTAGAEPRTYVTIASYANLSNASSKILSIGDNFGATGSGYSEKAFFDFDGALTVPRVNTTTIVSTLDSNANILLGAAGSPNAKIFYSLSGLTADADKVTLVGAVADGGSAVANVVDSVNTFSNVGAKPFSVRNHGSERWAVRANGDVQQFGTDSSGTPGAATVNKGIGTAAIASGATSVVITNSLVTDASHVLITWMGDLGTQTKVPWVTRASGSFTVNVASAPGSNVPFCWQVKTLG